MSKLIWLCFVKTAAELEKRKENFSKELDFVCADVVCALILTFQPFNYFFSFFFNVKK